MNKHLYLTSSEVVQEAPAGLKVGPTEALVSRVIIGERVRQARIAANMTQQELAGETYSKSYISAVERGKMTPSFQALRILADRLGRSLSFFFGEGEAPLGTPAESGAATGVLPDGERQRREERAKQMLKEAEEWLVKSQPDKALEALHVSADAPPADLPTYEQPRWYRLAGWASLLARKFPEAINWLESGLGLVETLRTQAPSAQKAQLGEMAERMRELLGGCYYDQGQPARALEHHLQCLIAITDGVVTDPELKLLIYKALGNDNMVLGRHDEAILFYQRACKLAEDMNEPRQRGLAYWGLGLTYKASGDLFRAKNAFGEALSIFGELEDTLLTSRLHAVLGVVLIELKEYKAAEQHLRLALEAAERINDAYARQVALGNVAILRLAQSNPDEAIKAAQEGLSAVSQSKDPRIEGQIYQTLAEAYEARQDVSAAGQAYKDAITTLAQTEDGEFIGRVHDRYGSFLASQGRFEEAYEQIGLAQAVLARKTAIGTGESA
ncbi:MAG TPA: tetratricopeptide repeat protein [Ktedonobacterales bacterium]|jgi:tetratricopeptide (TPR) repeat protein